MPFAYEEAFRYGQFWLACGHAIVLVAVVSILLASPSVVWLSGDGQA